MRPAGGKNRGFSMIELLAVLAIVGVLAYYGVAMVRPRSSDSVRSVMGELEGVLLNAQHTASLSSQDVYIASTGNWTDGTLKIDARPMVPTATTATPPVADLAPGNAATRLGSTSEIFATRYLQNQRDHMYAGIATTTAWLTTSLGTATNLKDLPLFATTAMAGFRTALGNPLCTGSFNYVVLNSISRSFDSGFCIVVVGMRGGQPIPSGPVGIIAVPAGGANIYKYFKPNGSNTWGRM